MVQNNLKKIDQIIRTDDRHWVGDGFHVKSLFSYNQDAEKFSPFLLLDYASPTEFPSTKRRLGVGEHAHRGFETVTVVYDGEVEHRDSTGGGGKISKGDVQWMTAASGIVHEEFHSHDFATQGGKFHMVQLWVNLPAKYKMSKPGYQPIESKTIPSVSLSNDAGKVRVIAGQYQDAKGPAKTFTPIEMWDVHLHQGKETTFTVPDGFTTMMTVLSGSIQVNGDQKGNTSDLILMQRDGESITIRAIEDSTILFLAGEPIDEPIVGHGPFVMNSKEEIAKAIYDYQTGKMGKLS